MKPDEEDHGAGFVSEGRLNRVVGWSLLLIGLALAASLDPWHFRPRPEGAYAASNGPLVRHAQGVLLAMAFLQLATSHLIAGSAFPRSVCRNAAWLTVIGSAFYAIGYSLGLLAPVLRPAVLVGSLMNFAAFAYLFSCGPSGPDAARIKMVLPVACFGMLLDFLAGGLFLAPEQFVLDFLGPADGVRLRMLRLARVAAIALSVLTLVYYWAAHRAGEGASMAVRRGHVFFCGVIGMPSTLAAACFTSVHFKYLLTIPATAVLIGVLIGLRLSLQRGTLLERWGWLLIAASISAGMLMGLYAFDGPLPTPKFLGPYNETARRLSRIAHSYAIVFGLTAILLSMEFSSRRPPRTATIAALLFVAGSSVALLALLMQMVIPLPDLALRVGPAFVFAATIVWLAFRVGPKKAANGIALQ